MTDAPTIKTKPRRRERRGIATSNNRSGMKWEAPQLETAAP